MRRFSMMWFGLGFVIAILVSGGLQMASAQPREGYGRGGSPLPRFVVAYSRFGGDKVVGAVRRTSLGPQVQLPGGSWIYCRISCSETLRVETVDFWAARNGPGGRSVGAMEQGISIYLGLW